MMRSALPYSVLVRFGVVASLGLGLVFLGGLASGGWFGRLDLGAGAFFCLAAGWIAAAGWSTAYWKRTMARQVETWRRMTDAMFAWVEEVPVPTEALHRLRSSLEEARLAGEPGLSD